MTDQVAPPETRILQPAADLEELVFRHAWHEAGSMGIVEGEFLFADVTVSLATLVEMTGYTPEGARGFLIDDISLVEGDGGGEGWEAMLDGEGSSDSELPPVLLLDEDGWEILDGNHRICGHVANGGGDFEIVVGVRIGLDVERALSNHRLARFDIEAPMPAPRI